MEPFDLSESPGPGHRISRETLFGLSRQAPVAAPKVRQLHGQVRSGVERNSCVLVGARGEVLAQLMGGPPEVVTDGRFVVVTGVFLTDLLTTAQQGAPFRVQTAEPEVAPD